jgi:hypothetical protein
VTPQQEAALRQKLRLRSLHEINDAIAALRELEAAETPLLPFVVVRHVLQEIDRRFDGVMVEASIWDRVGGLAPLFSKVIDTVGRGDRDALFGAMNDLVAAWMELHASIG